MGLVFRVVRRFVPTGCASLEEADLVQAGAIGLMRALESFDPERGFSLGTYATHWIRHHIQREVMNHGRSIRVPVHTQEKLRMARKPLPCTTISLDAPSGPDNSPKTLHDTIGDAEADPTDQLRERERQKAVAIALTQLPERTRRIIRDRFWGERTLAQVGDALGVTRERVRQLEAGALTKLRKHMEVAR